MAALQESLSRFRKQQEKCQSTLTSIAAKGNHPKTIPSNASTLRIASAVKFSEDTKRLQDINSIRNSSTGYQTKLVIDLLKKTREALTAEQINGRCYVDINANKALFDSLRQNLKVSYNGNRFSYKSKHELRDKSQLYNLIRKFPEGIPAKDFEDSYPTVMDDLQALKASGKIWLLSNSNSREDVAYPNDEKAVIKVDDDLKELFRSIELPLDMIEIEKDLQKNGMKPATNTAKRRETAHIHGIPPKEEPKKKRRELSKRTKLTNVHLPELFQRLNGS